MGSTSLVVAPNCPVFFSVWVNVCHLKLQNVTHEAQLKPPAPFGPRSAGIVSENRKSIVIVPLTCHVHHVWTLMPGIDPPDSHCPAFLVSGDEQNAVLNGSLVAPSVFNLRERTVRSDLDVQRRIGIIRLFPLPRQTQR